MKSSILSIICAWVAWSVVFAGGCLRGFAAPVAESSASPPSPPAIPVLTLEGAVRLALENNPEVRAASGRMAAAAGRAYQAGLWSNPALELSAEDWPVSGGGFADAKKLVGVSQTVPFPGKKNLDRQIGLAGVRLSESERILRRLELVREVKTTFFQVLAAQRLVDVSGELVRVAESSATTARKRVAAGAAADQEQLRAEIPLEQARTELSGYERELGAARQTLAQLLGRPELTETPISGALAETATPALLDRGPGRWLAAHPSVLAAKTSQARADLELRRAKLEPYPDVTVGAAGGQEAGGTGAIVQFSLSVPLPIIDRSEGKQQEARATLAIAAAERAAIEQRLLREWGVANRRYRTAIEQATNYRERILPRATEALRLVQTGFEQGKFGFIDLLDIQRTSAEVRLAYQHKLLELNVAQVELETLLAGNADGVQGRPASPLETKAP